jgi:hypothetical protein
MNLQINQFKFKQIIDAHADTDELTTD